MENLNEYRYNKAVEQVACIKSFYTHLVIYFLVMGVLAYVNYSTTSFIWVIFPAVGWGLGLLSHGFRAFGQNLIFGRDWEERKIKELMKNDSL